jgi:small subunit ribosomal protein S2
MAANQNYEKINKKEILQLSREQEKLEKTLGGIKEMGGLPDVLFVIDVGYEKIAVQEAAKLGIPVVGVVDTNNSPDNIDYIVPGNDDSMRAIKLYTRLVADAVLDGKQSIAVGADGEEELIEVENDASQVTPKPAVKVTSKKAAAEVKVAGKAADSEATAAEEKPVAEEAVAEEKPVAEEAVAEEKPVAEEAVTVEKSAAEEAVAEEPVAEDEQVDKAADGASETAAETAQVEAAPEKVVAKKAATKKAAAKKAAPKKAAAKKAAPKKAATKKAATKKAASGD